MTIMVDIMVTQATVDGLLIIMHPGIVIIQIIGLADHHTVAWGIIVQVTQDVVGEDSSKNTPTPRHPERSEGSPDLARGLLQEIPHCVRDDVIGASGDVLFSIGVIL